MDTRKSDAIYEILLQKGFAESLCREILWMIDHPEECRVYGARAGEKTLYSTKGFTEFLGLLDDAQQREEMSCETETVLLSR